MSDFDLTKNRDKWTWGRGFTVFSNGETKHYTAGTAWREEDGRLLVAGPLNQEHEQVGTTPSGQPIIIERSVQYAYNHEYDAGTWTFEHDKQE